MWIVLFDQDTEVPGVGTVTAVDGSVRFSRRLNTEDSEDITLFLEEATSVKAKQDTGVSNADAVRAKIEAVLNADKA